MKNPALPLQQNGTLRLTAIPSHPAAPEEHFAWRPEVACLSLVLQLLALPLITEAQPFADDFNDGNDTGWRHYDPIATASGGGPFVHYSFPNGAYRIQADASPMPEKLGPARGASLRSTTFTDFYVAVDVVAWNNSIRQVFGPLARVTDVGPGTTDGFTFSYQTGDQSISIAKITDEDGNDISGTSKPLTLDLAKAYRFVFIGKGASLEGRVYELPDTRNPIAVTTATDPSYPSGINGLLVFHDPPPGTSTADATFDNYFELDVEPPMLTLTPLIFGDLEVTWPKDATGFQLQTSSVVSSADWTTIPPSSITTRDNLFVYLTSFQAVNTFFRLVRP